MIATILPSSPTFHAVAYNEKKVAQGSASLIEMKNLGPYDVLGYSDASQLQKYLIDYSAANSRIKQPQFHLAISCKGHDYTPQQLLEIAHQYLEQMGYGDPEQPLLVYEHHDTDNTHIHIVTSRVDPRGKKINDSNERRRGQKVLEKIMKTNLKEQAQKDVKAAMAFDFRDANQFKAVMQAMNYECYIKNDTVYIKKGGMIQITVPFEEVNKKIERNKLYRREDPAEYAKWRAIFRKYRDTNTSRAGLERDLKKMFGMSLVFLGSADNPYGYLAIDFNTKKVHEGYKILHINQLQDFMTPEEHIQQIEEFVNNAFLQNPELTTKQLNRKLGRLGAYIKKGCVVFGNIKKPLALQHTALLDRNNKVDWRNGFKPQTEEERDLVCKLTGWDYPDTVKIHQNADGKYYSKDYAELQDIFSKETAEEKVNAFQTAGFRFIRTDDNFYAYRADTQTIVNLKKAEVSQSDINLLASHFAPMREESAGIVQKDRKQQSRGSGIPRSGMHGRSDNREWEVGKRGTDRDDMDRNGGMSY